ncbi:MAG: hypothetical protein ACRCSN_11285 [Dermatophilaceae bacterium]
MEPARPRRRALLLGAGPALALAGGAVHVAQRSRPAELVLHGETVAFAEPGIRELVPTGRADAVMPGSRVLAARPSTNALLEEESAWLASCAGWTRHGEHGDALLRDALLDLRVLSVGLPVSVAGWSRPWRYAWPRDVSFVATALARVGLVDDAVAQLRFLQDVQRGDGGFEARYDLGTGRAPDARAPQLDGSGWVLWAAHEIARAAGDRAPEVLSVIRPLLVRSSRRLLGSLDPVTSLPPPSPDYWELAEDTLTLGTAAAVLAGLRAATRVLPSVGEAALADRTGAATERCAASVRDGFGSGGYPRHLGGAGSCAAVTFLAAPVGPRDPDPGVVRALDRAQRAMGRPAGGLAPGSTWKQDGVSWTPQTALFAAAWAATGHGTRARALLSWLGAHRTTVGSLPEKVLHDGRPAAVAPLAWTASLVVLARHELSLRP